MTVRDFSVRLAEAGFPLLPSGVANVETCQRRVAVGEAVIMARVLGVDLAEMLSGEPIVITRIA